MISLVWRRSGAHSVFEDLRPNHVQQNVGAGLMNIVW